MTEHPITPPPELLAKWEDEILKGYKNVDVQLLNAYQAGADAELEAFMFDLADEFLTVETMRRLRAARRPKPPSLKEQALEVLGGLEKRCDLQCNLGTIRRALEALSDAD
jgi:hypothetical protein